MAAARKALPQPPKKKSAIKAMKATKVCYSRATALDKAKRKERPPTELINDVRVKSYLRVYSKKAVVGDGVSKAAGVPSKSCLRLLSKTSVALLNVEKLDKTGRPRLEKTYDTFSNIFDEKAGTEFVYRNTAQELVRTVTAAKSTESVCVFILVNGITGSGKTFTMHGIVQMVARDIYENPDKPEVSVTIKEICCDKVCDLLAGPSAKEDLTSKIKNHHGRDVWVSKEADSAASLVHIVKSAQNGREIAATSFNPVSSRSHTITEITVNGSTIALVDLAGAEGKHPLAEELSSDRREKERAFISVSLSDLLTYISRLSQKCPPDKMLTQLIHQVIGKKKRIVIDIILISCTDLSVTDRSKTRVILEFAKTLSGVKKMRICPAKSEMPLQNTFSETVATTVHAPTLEDSQRENVLLKRKNAMLQKELDDANNTHRSPEGLFITMRDTSESQVTPLASDLTGTSTAGHSSPDNPSSGERRSHLSSISLFGSRKTDQSNDALPQQRSQTDRNSITTSASSHVSDIEVTRGNADGAFSPETIQQRGTSLVINDLNTSVTLDAEADQQSIVADGDYCNRLDMLESPGLPRDDHHEATNLSGHRSMPDMSLLVGDDTISNCGGASSVGGLETPPLACQELSDFAALQHQPGGYDCYVTVREQSDSQVTPLSSDRTGTSTAGHSSPDNRSSGEQDSKFKGGPSLNLFPLGTIDQPVDVAIVTSPSDTYYSEIELPRCRQSSFESPQRCASTIEENDPNVLVALDAKTDQESLFDTRPGRQSSINMSVIGGGSISSVEDATSVGGLETPQRPSITRVHDPNTSVTPGTISNPGSLSTDDNDDDDDSGDTICHDDSSMRSPITAASSPRGSVDGLATSIEGSPGSPTENYIEEEEETLLKELQILLPDLNGEDPERGLGLLLQGIATILAPRSPYETVLNSELHAYAHVRIFQVMSTLVANRDLEKIVGMRDGEVFSRKNDRDDQKKMPLDRIFRTRMAFLLRIHAGPAKPKEQLKKQTAYQFPHLDLYKVFETAFHEMTKPPSSSTSRHAENLFKLLDDTRGSTIKWSAGETAIIAFTKVCKQAAEDEKGIILQFHDLSQKWFARHRFPSSIGDSSLLAFRNDSTSTKHLLALEGLATMEVLGNACQSNRLDLSSLVDNVNVLLSTEDADFLELAKKYNRVLYKDPQERKQIMMSSSDRTKCLVTINAAQSVGYTFLLGLAEHANVNVVGRLALLFPGTFPLLYKRGIVYDALTRRLIFYAETERGSQDLPTFLLKKERDLKQKKRIIQMVLTQVYLLQSWLGGVHRDLKLANFVVSESENLEDVTVVQYDHRATLTVATRKSRFAVRLIDYGNAIMGSWPTVPALGTATTLHCTPPEGMFGRKTDLLQAGWDTFCLAKIVMEILLGTRCLFASFMEGSVICPKDLSDHLLKLFRDDTGNTQKHTRHLTEIEQDALVQTAFKCMILAHDPEYNYVKLLDRVYNLTICEILSRSEVKDAFEMNAKSYALLTGTKMSPIREALSKSTGSDESKHPFSEPIDDRECQGLMCLLLSLHPDANIRPTPIEMGKLLPFK